ncbi:hypothetical protein PTSG_00441 [Salpingoeca rosetta]|uniref:Importin N-terminal domain-containing protein n=1 Tax=Salpingoeca rosetta (strain ATCC 50818 / BSB-021) TaxID=946362 RepID=F2TWH6_SALR5|nr:uncharacterized protein PTSG_00441 [Salpingoeca rosetta]EGD72422.1 hypothetical protein PTSG_00441 [Salpingoeca rosetta]|eukprot:XP_004998991.1 hypothetical protein PTSG_00441 [Salpingoeca rosetta]
MADGSGLSEWHPDQEKLAYVYNLLADSQNPERQEAAKHDLENLCESPEFSVYLAYIFTSSEEVDTAVRASAGLLLKNNILRRAETVDASVVELLKESIFQALLSESHLIRTTASIMIAAIAVKTGVTHWPQLLPALFQLIDSNNPAALDGAFTALRHVVEDCHQTMTDKSGKEAATSIITKAMHFFQHDEERIRAAALQICNQFIISPCTSLLELLPTFIQGIFALAADTDLTVQRHVCEALVMLFEVRLDHILPHVLPHIDDIVQYILMCCQSEDTALAQEACEFWIAVADATENDFVSAHLDKILPVLLDRMCYTEDDIEWLKTEMRDDADEQDREQDIRPHHHKTKAHTHAHSDVQSAVNGFNGATASDAEDDDDDDDDDDPFLGGAEQDDLQWGLRRSAAAGLDLLANRYHDAILPTVVPLIESLFQSSEWPRVESGILALGAIAEGCMSGLSGYLPTLIPYLIDLLQNEQPLIRSITSWTMSRYCRWVVTDPEGQKLFDDTVKALLHTVNDRNKRVQQAACSAFAQLEEVAEDRLEPHLPLIIDTLMHAYKTYQRKNMVVLYDAIGTLADSVGPALAHPELVERLMPPLLERYSHLADDDTELFALLECLTAVAGALGEAYHPFAPDIFQHCVKLTQQTLEQAQFAHQDPSIDYPNPDFCVVPVDHISAMVEALQEHMGPLIQQSNLLALLEVAMTNDVPDVRQSAFALLGDVSKAAFCLVQPHLDDVFALMAQNMNPAEVAVCNNVVWCIGEIAMQLKGQIQPLLERHDMCTTLIQLMTRPMTAKTLLENVAITIGRISMFWQDALAQHLSEYLAHWSMALRDITDSEEKEHAFMGMCHLVKRNPNGALRTFIFFCDAINSFQTPSDDLLHTFHDLFDVNSKVNVAISK